MPNVAALVDAHSLRAFFTWAGHWPVFERGVRRENRWIFLVSSETHFPLSVFVRKTGFRLLSSRNRQPRRRFVASTAAAIFGCCQLFFLPDLGERVELPNQLRVVEIVDVIAGGRRLLVLQLHQRHDTHRAVLRAVGVGACVKVPSISRRK